MGRPQYRLPRHRGGRGVRSKGFRPRATPPDVVEIDKSVAELEARLEELRIKRSRLLSERALIARVPPEILSRIFEFGVDDNLNFISTLSLVSHYWRNLVLATPSLWTYIVLDPDWGYGRGRAFLRKLRVCLERSQACKLLVDIDSPPRAMLLLPGLCPDWAWMLLVRDHATALGPCLEELYLRIDPTDSDETAPVQFLTQPCPRLNYIVLEHTPLRCIQVDLPALRQLHLVRDQRYHSPSRIAISFKELLAQVKASPALEELRVQSAMFFLDCSEDVFQAAPAPTPIPSLTELSLNLLDAPNVAVFLESTDLPSLTRLAVQMDHTAGEDLHWLALASPQRFPALRHLDLRACTLEGAALVPFVRALHQLPQLTALGLSAPPSGTLGGRIFDLLAAGPSATGSWLLPRLQAICLQSCRDISGHELMRVICARRAAPAEVAEIQYLKIAQCYSLDPEVLEHLRALVPTVRAL
ncbi:hypothetical protein A0H81_12552 [Grifola frondosa]|uniref:F-box domain-containing protein n=1 Tax=Grifola frondosa TaxID=5627 RepID=A0A1C7LS98_GRIFR|nr:hypothetical protein A0H81_12552 [Grifola frondosa]